MLSLTGDDSTKLWFKFKEIDTVVYFCRDVATANKKILPIASK